LGELPRGEVEGEIDATNVWTGEPARDAHLRSADFFDTEHHPKITFKGRLVERTGGTHFEAAADVTIRGNTRPVEFDVAYLGQWETPFWVGDENRGTMRRIGFEGRTRVNRHHFGVSWQDHIPGDGLLVGDEVDLVLDIEAIHEGDLERTGAIEYYRGLERVPSTCQAGSPEVPAWSRSSRTRASPDPHGPQSR